MSHKPTDDAGHSGTDSAWEAERARVLSSGRPWIPAAAGVLALAVVAALFLWKPHHVASPAMTPRIVIAKLSNSTGNATFDGSLQQALELSLDQSPFLDIMTREPGTPRLQPQPAREACRRAGRQVLLSGDVERVGNGYLFTLEATACSGSRVIAEIKQPAANESDLLNALDTATEKLRAQLGEDAQSIRNFNVPIAQAATPSLEALKAYNAALDAHDATALGLYQSAVSLDPNFALAQDGLATSFAAQNEPKLAAEAAKRAYELSRHTSERAKFAIQARYHATIEDNLPATIGTARLWAVAYPQDARPWLYMAAAYNEAGQFAQAIDAGRKALALAPAGPEIYAALAQAELRANHFDEAKKLGEQARAHNALSPALHSTLYQAALATQDTKLLAQEEPCAGTLAAQAAAAAGRLAEFRHRMQEARQKALDSKQQNVAGRIALEEAMTLYSLGFPEEARRLLPNAPVNDAEAEAAYLRTRLGDQTAAHTFLNAQLGTIGTRANFRDIPLVSAALALANHRPEGALNALAPAAPYELADFEILSIRGSVYLQLDRLHEAEQEYRKITTNPGIDPASVQLPLAHLQLARIYAHLGNPTRSREEYQALFALWQNAAPDLPLLQQARREAAMLKAE